MNMPKAHTWLLVAVFALISNPLRAAETWYCEYSNYRQTDKHQSWFHVEGNRLVENSGDVIVDYQLLEDSKAAIVAATGGSYASKPRVMGFLLMIKKDTGQFVLTTASVGTVNSRQAGQCRLTGGSTSK